MSLPYLADVSRIQMPIFDYRCEACAHVFDVLQSASAQPPAACPACGGDRLKKLLSAPHIHRHGTAGRQPAATGLGQAQARRPPIAHTLDSPVPHAEHHHDHHHHHAGCGHGPGHRHDK